MAKKLKPEHKIFCEEYKRTKNVFHSLNFASIELKTNNPKGYYVYFLCEESTGNIFYVGKGKGRRMRDHLLKSNKSNNLKLSKINSILSNGGKVVTVVFEDRMFNDCALDLESVLISEIDGLTNIVGNGKTLAEISRGRAENILDSMIRPCELLYKEIKHIDKGLTNYDIYNNNVNELKKIIRDPSDYINFCM